MEKDKEAVKKSCSFYATKKVEAAKTNFVNNNSRFPVRSDSARNKYSYISRNKNASVPTDKKLGLYGNKNKSYLKHTCDKCEIKARPHLVLNPGAGNSFTTTTQVQSGHDLNGNFSFNTYPTLYNFAPSVSEISTLNKVLSYQSNQHYELSIPESSKHKQRTTFFEQRTYNSKIAHSNNSYSASRFFPFPNPGIRWHCSNEFPQSFTVSEPHFKALDRYRENIIVNEKYNSKYDRYAVLPDPYLNNGVKFADLPVFVNSSPVNNFSVDYFDEQLQIKKQRNYSSKKWDRFHAMSDFGENSKKCSDESDKMLFPALSTNSHNQQRKLNSSYTSMPPSGNLSNKNSGLEISQSLLDANISSAVSPSSTSATPQASYADVIRMSSTCSGVQGYISIENNKAIPEQNQLLLSKPIQEKLPKNENPQPGSSDWVISKLSQLNLSAPEPGNVALTHCHQNGQNFVAPRPVVVSLEKPSFYNSSLQACKNVLNSLSSNTNFVPADKKVLEVDDCLISLEKSSIENVMMSGSTNRSSVSSDFTASMTDTQMASMKTDSVYSSPSSISSFGDAFKSTENRDLTIDNFLKKEPPVIIMNNCSPPDSMSEISFGIEYEEMVKLCSDNCSVEDCIPHAVQDSGDDSLSDESIKTDTSHPKSPIPLLSESILPLVTSEIETPHISISIKGKTLYWKESDVNYNKSNHSKLAEYLSSVWNDIGKETEKEQDTTHMNGSIH